jgi:hypothetical protein
MPEDLMKEEQSYERLLQALQDMKAEIAKQIRPVEEQIIHANVEHLRQTFNQESRRLINCLEEIDDNDTAAGSTCWIMTEFVPASTRSTKLTPIRRRYDSGAGWLAVRGPGDIVRQRIEDLRSREKFRR